MRFIVALAVVSAASAALVARQNLPSCAASCLANAVTGNCAPTDDTCLCRNQAFINSTSTCFSSSCTGGDLQNADAFAQQLCLAVGVTLTAATPSSTSLPSSTSSPSTSGASTTTRVSVFVGGIAALVISAIVL